MQEPFVFKHVRGGKPLAPSEIPKLPTAALMSILTMLRERNLGTQVGPTNPSYGEISNLLSVEIVAIALKRMEPTITKQDVLDDEDYDTVMRFYRHLQATNPAIFPPAPSKDEAVVSDPKSVPPA